ncbi:TonB-dependent receptor domain-containing protein [Aquimarina sp. I32.4]|uniref:TonB-dependent receptor domain-containing protein n=1 Tax=Aquimarina sp. I32.4 TaxID=2053903 RepID=UPI001304FADC|nr:TonB-dependent receptor [Aquimarina sp. I32.4]
MKDTNNRNYKLERYFNITDKLTLDFGGSFSNAKSDEPDRRQNTFLQIDDEYRTTTGSAGLNHRFFSKLNEDDIAGKTILTYDLNTSDSDDQKKANTIELGINYRKTERQFDFIQYSTNFESQILVDKNNIDALFNQQSIDTNIFSLVTDRGRAGNSNALTPFFYTADRTIFSPFGSTTLSLVENLTLNLGVRLDNVEQIVDYDTELISSISNPASGPTGKIEENYILPSMSIKYNLSENSILRLAGSKTYTLPQFIEVAPFLYEDVNFSRFGNPLLQPSDDYNVDLKYEWYPTSGEIIAITGFFKYIDYPINTIEVNSAGNDISFVNTPEATAFGVELEIRKDVFNKEAREGANGSHKLTTGLNVSYLNTKQTLEDVDTDELTVRFTNKEDNLSGASDLLINADLTYTINREKYDFLSSLVFNYFSDRIFTIGVAGRENIVETGIPTLDFINKLKLGKHFGISISAKNILDPKFTLTQDTTAGETIDLTSYKKGINISAGISYKF